MWLYFLWRGFHLLVQLRSHAWISCYRLNCVPVMNTWQLAISGNGNNNSFRIKRGGGRGQRIGGFWRSSSLFEILISKKEMASGNTETESEMADMAFAKRGCCFWMPCLGSERSARDGSVWWERVGGPAEKKDGWWSRGLNALKQIREWTEIHAGPRWKTFIRQFGKSRGGGGGRHGKFNYDPLSYAMNFDEGPRQYGHLDEDHGYPDFSYRYASSPPSVKSSMDLGNDGPSFTWAAHDDRDERTASGRHLARTSAWTRSIVKCSSWLTFWTVLIAWPISVVFFSSIL